MFLAECDRKQIKKINHGFRYRSKLHAALTFGKLSNVGRVHDIQRKSYIAPPRGYYVQDYKKLGWKKVPFFRIEHKYL